MGAKTTTAQVTGHATTSDPPYLSQTPPSLRSRKGRGLYPSPSQKVIAAGLPQRDQPVHLQSTALRNKRSRIARSDTHSHCKICISKVEARSCRHVEDDLRSRPAIEAGTPSWPAPLKKIADKEVGNLGGVSRVGRTIKRDGDGTANEDDREGPATEARLDRGR